MLFFFLVLVIVLVIVFGIFKSSLKMEEEGLVLEEIEVTEVKNRRDVAFDSFYSPPSMREEVYMHHIEKLEAHIYKLDKERKDALIFQKWKEPELVLEPKANEDAQICFSTFNFIQLLKIYNANQRP